jgi:hypothetical protein
VSRLKCETASPHLTLPMYPIIPIFHFPRFQSHRAPGGRNVRNEANLSIADWGQTSGGAADCAERTQLGLPPRGRGGRNVPNEPNLGKPDGRTQGPVVQTNPISRRCRAGRGQGAAKLRISDCGLRIEYGVAAGPSVPNKPNLACFLGAAEGEMCKTNPISESWPGGEMPSIPLIYRSTIPVRCPWCETKPKGSSR